MVSLTGVALSRPEGRQSPDPLISIVIPCYDEEDALHALHRSLTRAFASRRDFRYQLVFVDDGSKDATAEILRDLAAGDGRTTVVTLSRDFGQQYAITAGLQYASGDAVILCDADLQDGPDAMLQMIDRWRKGADVVYGVRNRRKEPAIVRASYFAFYRVLRMLAEAEIPVDSGDFGLMDRKVVEVINALPERNRFVRGMRAWVGFRQVALPYQRQARLAGRSKYSLARLIRLAFDGIFDFSTKPLTVIFWMGLLASFLSLAGFMFVLIHRLLGFKIFGHSPAEVPGYTTVMLALFFLGGVQLLAIGVLGEYVGRIYKEVKQRPGSVVKAVLNPGQNQEQTDR